MTAPDEPSRPALSFRQLQSSGVLWAINRQMFHPRGFALAIVYSDNDELIGWKILGDGTEVWTFTEDADDESFADFAEFMSGWVAS